MKYKLTFFQRQELIPVWFMWITTDKDKRVSWHNLLKGSENHEHKFTKPYTQQGYKFLMCEHEGCNLYESID